MNCLIEDERLALRQYTRADSAAFMDCWRDETTQRGYNFILPEAAQGDIFGTIEDFPFWVVAVDKSTGDQVGVLRLSPEKEQPDLAIWVYPSHRGKGWGERMYRLALKYLFANGHETIYAGCFPFNKPSLRILEKNGFVRWPDGDTKETSAFDGSEIVMLGFRCHRNA